VTPETHRRVNSRAERQSSVRASSLRDAFGWSRCFDETLLPKSLLSELLNCGLVTAEGERLRAQVRFSSLGEQLYAHSAFPTLQQDAVFFGPDTYRFCAFLGRAVGRTGHLVDVGCGSGAGGLSVAAHAKEVVLADISPRALGFAEVNAELAGVRVTLVQSDVLKGATGTPELVVSNPPYLRDSAARSYRDGGGQYGEALAVRIAREALARLAPRGRLLLYSGAAIVEGRDTLFEALRPALEQTQATIRYEELDPDVFGEELELPYYANVERLAAVALQAVLP
jgi:methylase of polypeptide subunit release factors